MLPENEPLGSSSRFELVKNGRNFNQTISLDDIKTANINSRKDKTAQDPSEALTTVQTEGKSLFIYWNYDEVGIII